VAVEAPAEGGVLLEPLGIGGVDEGEADPLVGRVGLPESLVTPEVGETRVDPHAGAGGDDQRPGAPDGPRRLRVDRVEVVHLGWPSSLENRPPPCNIRPPTLRLGEDL
jgi:hypothetical protein